MQPEEELLVVTSKGYGKRTPVEEYKIQTRGGKGLLTYDKSKFRKTGELVGATVVDDEDEILLINSDGVIIRVSAKDISKLGRATQGVKIMKTDENTDIISLAKVIREEEHEMDKKLAQNAKKEAKTKAEAQKAEAKDEEQIKLDIDK